MFQLPSFKLPLLRSEPSSPGISITPVKIYDIETSQDKRTRTLKHLLRANHVNHSIIYYDLRYHNHMPHILGSSWILGAGPELLNTIYDQESKELEPWTDSPGEISRHDWRGYIGQRNYQRAFVDFFEDELVRHSFDWKIVLQQYMFEGSEPLISSLVSGLAHPLIHLGYAYELSNRDIAMEALAMAACFHSPMHKYIDDPSYTKPSSYRTTSPLEILHHIHNDKRFDVASVTRGDEDMHALFDHEALVLEHWNAWDLTNPTEQFRESQEAAVNLLLGTHESSNSTFNFFFVHTLNSSHAVRVLLGIIPPKLHVPLVRQWLLFVITTYITESRPLIKQIPEQDVKGRDWKWVENRAVEGKHNTDAHFVKGLRAMKVAAETWGDEQKRYLKAALIFADEFDSWGD